MPVSTEDTSAIALLTVIRRGSSFYLPNSFLAFYEGILVNLKSSLKLYEGRKIGTSDFRIPLGIFRGAVEHFSQTN